MSTFVSETQALPCTDAEFAYIESMGLDIEETICARGHQTPKTLAVIDVDRFMPFVQAWEALSAELLAILQAENDPIFHSQLARARATAVAFDGVLDQNPRLKSGSELDMGSFLAEFQSLCELDPNSLLAQLVRTATLTYEQMFVAFEIGPGTPPATGMAIFWPTKATYQEDFDLFDSENFNPEHPYYTAISPNWNAFLDAYYDIDVPAIDSVPGGSVCFSCEPAVAQEEGELLVNTMVDLSGWVVASAGIVPRVDYVEVQYGLDLTPLVFDNNATNATNGTRIRMLKAAMEDYQKNGFRAMPERFSRQLKGTKAGSLRARRTQEDDYFLVFGGSLNPIYGCNDFSATWDGQFYQLYLIEQDTAEWIYAEARGGTMYSIPMMYFGKQPSNDFILRLQSLELTYEEALAAGGMDAEITFSIDPCDDFSQNMVLYTYNGGNLAEMPPSSGGYLVPIVFVELNVGASYVLGGFSGTIFEWNEDQGIVIISFPAPELFEVLAPVDTSVLDVLAVSVEGNETTTDFESFLFSEGDFDLVDDYFGSFCLGANETEPETETIGPEAETETPGPDSETPDNSGETTDEPDTGSTTEEEEEEEEDTGEVQEQEGQEEAEDDSTAATTSSIVSLSAVAVLSIMICIVVS